MPDSAVYKRPIKVDVNKKIFQAIDNYIYLYHTNTLIILPGFPANIQDNTSVSFTPSTSLGRSAPIYSYTGSGPRSIQIDLDVHRESVNLMNYGVGKTTLFDPGDDYVDLLVKQLQAAALPTYAASEKMVDPPLVACRFGDDIYIKGVVNGSVGIAYEPPILRTGKMARVRVGFSVSEVDAYDAIMVSQIGSYRDPGDIMLNPTLEDDVYFKGIGSGTSNMISSGTSNRANRVFAHRY